MTARSWRSRIRRRIRVDRSQTNIILAVLALIILVGSGIVFYPMIFNRKPIASNTATERETVIKLPVSLPMPKADESVAQSDDTPVAPVRKRRPPRVVSQGRS